MCKALGPPIKQPELEEQWVAHPTNSDLLVSSKTGLFKTKDMTPEEPILPPDLYYGYEG
jgi:hypothetical protein